MGIVRWLAKNGLIDKDKVSDAIKKSSKKKKKKKKKKGSSFSSYSDSSSDSDSDYTQVYASVLLLLAPAISLESRYSNIPYSKIDNQKRIGSPRWKIVGRYRHIRISVPLLWMSPWQCGIPLYL